MSRSRGQTPVWTEPQPYSYTDADGIERVQHLRYPLDPPLPGRTKTFVYRYKRSGQWRWEFPRRWDSLIYQLPEVIVRRGQGVYLCEGEKDADSLRYQGVVATSHHGVGKMTVENARWLVGAPWVVVCKDNDGVGDSKAAASYTALRRAGVAGSQLPIVRAAEGKDVTDHLDAGLALRDLILCDPASITFAAKRVSRQAHARLGYRVGA